MDTKKDKRILEMWKIEFAELEEKNKVLQDRREHELKKAYEAGWKRGVWLYAIHRDGELLVGCLERPYKAVIEEGPPEDYMKMDLEAL